MGRNREDDITPLQQETLDEICRYVSAKGYPPTIKELSDKFGISHASIHDRINQLVRKGFLQREDRKARSIVVVRNPRTDLKGKWELQMGHVRLGTLPRSKAWKEVVGLITAGADVAQY